MTSAEADAIIESQLAEGIKLLNNFLVLATCEMVKIAGDNLDQPDVRAAFDAEHRRMQKWHAETIALLEARLLRAAGRPHH